MKHAINIGVFAIMHNNNNEILLIHRTDKDLRNLPGGGLEKGESPEDCIIREIQEETGLIVSVEQLISIYTKKSGNGIVFLFQCIVTGGKLQYTDESDSFIYVNQSSIPANTLDKHVERINDYYSFTGKLIMKYQ